MVIVLFASNRPSVDFAARVNTRIRSCNTSFRHKFVDNFLGYISENPLKMTLLEFLVSLWNFLVAEIILCSSEKHFKSLCNATVIFSVDSVFEIE